MIETHHAVSSQPDDVVAADRLTMTSETPDDAVPAEGNFIAGTRDENPIWLRRRRRNAAESPLYILNDELILDIIDKTDPLDRHVLWFTSARFMRLVSTLTMPVPPWIMQELRRLGGHQASLEECYAQLRKNTDYYNDNRLIRALPDSISSLPVHEQNILITFAISNFWKAECPRTRQIALDAEIALDVRFGDTIWTPPSVALLLETLGRMEEDRNQSSHSYPSSMTAMTAGSRRARLQGRQRLATDDGRRVLTCPLEEHKMALRALLHRDRAHKYCDRCKNRRQHTPDSMGLGKGEMKLEYWCEYCKSSHPSPCHRQAKPRPRTAEVVPRFCSPCRNNSGRLRSLGRNGKRPCFDCEPSRGSYNFALRVTTKPGRSGSPGMLAIPLGELSAEWFCLVDKAKVNICPHRALTLQEVTGYLQMAKATFDEVKSYDPRAKRSALDLSQWLGQAGFGCNSSAGRDLCLSESGHRNVRAVFSNDFSKLRIASRTTVFNLDTWRRQEGKISLDLIRSWTLDKANEDKMRGLLCPHVRLADGRLLLPFEQNHCACSDHHGENAEGNTNIIGSVADGHLSTALHLHYKKEPCCRCRSQNTVDCHVANKSSHKTHTEDFFEGNFGFLYPSTGHDYTCHQCQMVYSWTRGPYGPIYLQTAVLIDIKGATSASGSWPDQLELATKHWTKHADPESCFPDADADAEPCSEEEYADFYICPDSTCLAGKGRWDWIHFYLDLTGCRRNGVERSYRGYKRRRDSLESLGLSPQDVQDSFVAWLNRGY